MTGEEGAARRRQLATLTAALRDRLSGLIARDPASGWQLAVSSTPIQPLIVGDNTTALALAATLEAAGLWVPAIRPPTVPANTARLRITLSAAHTLDDIERLSNALAACRPGGNHHA